MSKEAENQTFNIGDIISRCVELAKLEYGEFKQEFVGYKVGNYWWDGWEWDNDDLTIIITQEQMQSLTTDDDKLNDMVGITMKELHHLLETNLEYYNFDDNISIRRCYKTLNQGWKRELLHIINGL